MKIWPLLIAVLLVAPRGVFAQTPPAAPAVSAKAKQEVKSPGAAAIDPAVIAALRKAFAAQRAKGSYRALLDTSVGGYVLPSLELEAVFPNRIRLKRSGLEIILVAGKGMVRRGDKWTAAPAELVKSLGAMDDPQQDEKLLGGATYAQSLGQIKTDEQPLAGYEIHVKRKGGGLTKAKFFLSPHDSLIRRVETKGEVQGKALITTMMVGDYGVPIQIELPK